MREPFSFLDILSSEEQQLLANHQQWRWVSTLTAPDVKPSRHPPKFAEFLRTHTHAPAHRELFLALSGISMFVLGEKIYRITPGVVMLFDRHEAHDREIMPWNRSRSCRHLWLHISNHHSVSSNINEIHAPGIAKDIPLKVISGHSPWLLHSLWDWCGNAADFSPVHWEFLKLIITSCLFESVSDWQNRSSTKPQELIVNSVCEHIRGNLAEELTLQSLSRFAGYSPYFFHRIFQKFTGQSLHSYVTEARLERAKELLAAGRSVSSVSDEVGMPSPAYFSRFFKKHTRFTPNHWQAVHQVQNQK
ncbi:MAG: helix-turn-helix transcriptional regulator [Chthoniobacterales bacterium]|nr:helix-turn-helix transcriptional regulator [Chthoniobacterales bacterium]